MSVTGTQLESVETLHSNIDNFACERLSANQFRVTIPSTTRPGQYDLWAFGDHGVSNLRAFSVGRHPKLLEVEPNESGANAMSVPLDRVVNGQTR